MEKANQDIVLKMIEYRKELHKIPELGLEEYKTFEYLKKHLEDLGYKIEVTAKTGILALKRGTIGKQTIAFRCDMDALTIEEKNEIDYKSTHDGKMHACGHDGHMSILLGFANYISKIEIKQNILLIFQPGEESPGGAEIIVKEGVLKKYAVDYIFGLHIFPHIKEGIIGIKSGPQMAMAAEIDIEIKGKSAHGAMPQNGVDSIYVASNLIGSYQSIISRNISPLEEGVITLGSINGGSARNILAESVNIKGTIRTFSNEVLKNIKSRIYAINEGIEKAFGVEINCEILEMYPPVINDNELFNKFRNSMSEDEYIITEPLMTAEDFSYYQAEIPGMFFLLGSENEEKGYIYPLHNSRFNFDQRVLESGLNAYIKICEAFEIF